MWKKQDINISRKELRLNEYIFPVDVSIIKNILLDVLFNFPGYLSLYSKYVYAISKENMV